MSGGVKEEWVFYGGDDCTVYEKKHLPRPLTEEEIKLVEKYLSEKYGIELPSEQKALTE